MLRHSPITAAGLCIASAILLLACNGRPDRDSGRLEWEVTGPATTLEPLTGHWREVMIDEEGALIAQLSATSEGNPNEALLRRAPEMTGQVDVAIRRRGDTGTEGGGVLMYDESTQETYYFWLGRREFGALANNLEESVEFETSVVLLELYERKGRQGSLKMREVWVVKEEWMPWNTLRVRFTATQCTVFINDQTALVSRGVPLSGPTRVGLFCLGGEITFFRLLSSTLW